MSTAPWLGDPSDAAIPSDPEERYDAPEPPIDVVPATPLDIQALQEEIERMKVKQDPSYSTAEVAALFEVSPDSVRYWIEQDMLAAEKVGRRYFVKKSEILRFAEEKYSH